MASTWRVCIFAVFLLVAHAARAVAQDGSIIGQVQDEGRGVLPGVTVTAVALDTGRQFVDVSNERGDYRLVGLPATRYKVTAELTGFATSTLSEVELLVGQNATIAFTMKLAGLNENVTVTGEAPLVDTRQAQVAGNVDRRQMEALPINGRNWLALSTMVKGVTANTVTDTPGTNRISAFRVNLDGQEITQETSVAGFGQPGISRDAIAEYQIVTNLFDVTMGRSVGLQVQAVSRSGSNIFTGSTFGNFRSDRFNAADVYTNKVLPYSNQQVGGSQGGPLIKDKLHYFGSYEYQREPNTTVLGPAPYGGQTIQLPSDIYQHMFMGKLDLQMTANDHLALRESGSRWDNPNQFAGGPTRGAERYRDSDFANFTWSRVIHSNLLQEVKAGYFMYRFLNVPLARGPQTPEYVFPALTIGPNWNYPEDFNQQHFTTSYNLKWHVGEHDFKVGSEIRVGSDHGWWRARQRGQMFFGSTPSDFAARFPLAAWNDPSAWNFAGLDASALRYDIYYARDDNWDFSQPRPMYAGWIGDTWAVHPRLTLNLGLRYDVAWQDFIAEGVTPTSVIINNGFSTADYGYRNDIRDLNNIAPRVGFAWNATADNRLVIRGGSGIFQATQGSNQAIDQQLWNGQRVVVASFPNDGRPGFIADPTRGLTAQQVLSGSVALPPQTVSVIDKNYQMPFMWQSMLGFQKQLGDVLGVDADLIYQRGYNEDMQVDPNVFYDPVTGFPRPPSVAGRPNPSYGPINLKQSTGRSNYLALASSLNRRFRNKFQVGMTYTLMFYRNDTGIGVAGYGNQQLNPFNIDMDWGRSAEFQRHTVNANGLWSLPYGIMLAGSFHYGSGNYSTITSPNDPLGQVNGARRVLADLTVLPRNTFLNDPWQSFDLRVSKDFPIRGRVKLSAVAEVFNAYNYARFNRNTIYNNANFGKATSAGATSRTGQFSFRLAF